MSLKALFNAEDWNFLVALPYRIGLWMSRVEQGGGERAEQAEMDALKEVIGRAAAKYDNIEFIRLLIQDVSQAAPEIEDDSAGWESAPDDCARALSILATLNDQAALNCYKLVLIDIAEAVAKAAGDRDFGSHNLYGGPEKGIFGRLARLARLGHGPKVSPDEKRAINLLIDKAGANDLVQKWTLDPFKERG